MIKAGVGSSTIENSVEAANEAASAAMEQARTDECDWAVVFSTFPHRANYEEILKSVCATTKTKKVTGCSALGVLSSSGEIEAEPGVVVLAVSSSKVRAKPFIIHQLGAGGVKAGEEIGDTLKSSVDEGSLLTLLPDPFHIHPELLFQGVRSKLGGIPIVGASASEDPRINDTFEFFGDTVASGAVSGLLLSGDFSYNIDITQGCQLVGKTSVITGCNKNVISELDGEPALDVLKRMIPSSLTYDPLNIMRLIFVAFPPVRGETEITGGDYLVRNLIGLDPELGAIAVTENVEEGQTVSFTMRNPDMARQDLKQMLERVSSGNSPERPYKFGLYFNCCARGTSLYGIDGIDTAYISNALGDIPIAGFFGNAEFAPLRGRNHLFTYTGVLVLFSDK
jgi:small ligand-binding sensory domain FIST